MANETPLSHLPFELLPSILTHLRYDFASLARLSLVNKSFCLHAQPLLWTWLRLREVRLVSKVIYTLADSTKLCGYLRKLEIRAWPLASSDLDELEDAAVKTLRQAINLTTLHWTRKGSLSDRLMDAIRSCPKVEELELGGLSSADWTSSKITLISSPIRSLSLILPDRPILAILPHVVTNLPTLQDLTILCMNVNYFTSKDATALSEALKGHQIRSLALAGLPRIGERGIFDVLTTLTHLRYLALESCGVPPGLWSRIAERKLLPRLRGLKTTHPGPRHEAEALFWPSLERLCETSTELDSLCVYHSGQARGEGGKRIWPTLPASLGATLAARKGKPMRRLEIHSILCSLAVLVDFGQLKSLKDLTIHVYEKDMAALAAIVSRLPELRTLHILSQRADITPDEVLEMVESGSPHLQQVGLRNRVWTVRREPLEGDWDPSADAPPRFSSFALDSTIQLLGFDETAERLGRFEQWGGRWWREDEAYFIEPAVDA